MAVARWLLAIAISASLLACASGPRTTGTTTYRSARAYTDVQAGPAAFVGGAPSTALRANFDSRAAARGVRLAPDARLGWIAHFVVSDAARSAQAALWSEVAARHLGVFDAELDTTVLPAGPDPGRSISALLADKLRAKTFTHYGIALVEYAGQQKLSVVLAARRISLVAVPRSLPVGSTLQLRGRLADVTLAAHVDVIPPGAALTQLPLGHDREFSVQLPLTTRGLYRIEIVGERDGHNQRLAALPIYVGVAAPRRIALTPAHAVRDLAALKARVLARINTERQHKSLPALRRDSTLDDIAQRHCLDMREHSFVGHVSASSGDATQRVTQAGLASSFVLETLQRAVDARGLEAAAATGNGEARHALARELTHVGIGIVELPDAFGGTFVATELFAQLSAAPDLAAATPKLLSQVNQVRAQRGSGPLALDSGLSQIALRAAERFMADAAISEQATIDGAQHELGKFSLAYKRVNALLTVTNDLDEAATLEPALDARADALGIGIAQGRRPEQGAVLAVVMIVGSRR